MFLVIYYLDRLDLKKVIFWEGMRITAWTTETVAATVKQDFDKDKKEFGRAKIHDVEQLKHGQWHPIEGKSVLFKDVCDSLMSFEGHNVDEELLRYCKRARITKKLGECLEDGSEEEDDKDLEKEMEEEEPEEEEEELKNKAAKLEEEPEEEEELENEGTDKSTCKERSLRCFKREHMSGADRKLLQYIAFLVRRKNEEGSVHVVVIPTFSLLKGNISTCLYPREMLSSMLVKVFAYMKNVEWTKTDSRRFIFDSDFMFLA